MRPGVSGEAFGGRWERHQLQKLLGQVRIDDVVEEVWKLDRCHAR